MPSRSPSPPQNRLANETSAYLLQHRSNPVDWYPWGDEALESARTRDVPLLVSIGYSACHWCHVMEHESFEDEETAALMNKLFVSVKVDREERPDVDQIYMDTVVRLTGQGGWPLTVFCTPDGKPFYGGTYFPPEPRHGMPSFRQLLSSVSDAYQNRRGEVDRTAGQILATLAQRPTGVAQELPGAHSVVAAATELMRGADLSNGGFGGAPKFPTPTNLEMLLAALDFLPAELGGRVLEHCVFTCREMARRGLYDHLGGGFHRYCVDDHWGIPHFEKMLYDQGLLLRVYAEVLRRGGDERDLAWPVRETARYLAREMSGPEGGYYASQDADSEGVEGKFYVWRPDQIEAVLRSEGASFCEAYGVTAEGNFEGGTNHLIDRARAPREAFEAQREALRCARERRVPPSTDRKRVTSWNAYAISGLARAGSWLGDPGMVADAARTADFVLEHMVGPEGELLRIFNEGRAHVSGFLDDHAALLEALLDLHRATAEGRFLSAAVRTADAIASRFFDPDEGDLFLTPADGERLVHRPRSDHDGATPHASGLATLGLARLAALSGRRDLDEIADRVIRNHAFALEQAPHAYPTLLRAVALRARGLSVAVVIGDPDDDGTRALADRARRILAPEDAVLVAAPGAPPAEGVDPTWLQGREARGGVATAYMCRGRVCSLPVTDVDQLAPLPLAD
ncbi:MAG: thioredoxin domain-containing protein [Proteobacteria bacterium]|nr:thioredoxin domain-containing protein [Pseudomonadota bacterium]